MRVWMCGGSYDDVRHERGPRVLQKTTKEGRVTSYGPGFARIVKAMDEGTRGNVEVALKAWGSL